MKIDRPTDRLYTATFLMFIINAMLGVVFVVIGWNLKPDGGEVTCFADGKMNIKIGKVVNMDPKAITDSLFFLCDENTIGFGYLNPRVQRISGS